MRQITDRIAKQLLAKENQRGGTEGENDAGSEPDDQSPRILAARGVRPAKTLPPRTFLVAPRAREKQALALPGSPWAGFQARLRWQPASTMVGTLHLGFGLRADALLGFGDETLSMDKTATSINEALYDEFWQSCPDFSRYNPGVLHRRRAILKRLQSISFRSFLDVGCGDGELIVWLRERLAPEIAVTGVDLSSETISRNEVRHPHARFEVLNIEHQHLDRTFDAVICTEVIEHLDDRTAALGHLAAMVSPGGISSLRAHRARCTLPNGTLVTSRIPPPPSFEVSWRDVASSSSLSRTGDFRSTRVSNT